jgi:hypothetical protein
VQAIDAARGISMLLVCISNFAWVHLRGVPSHTLEATVLERVSMVASPTFITLSGLLLGFLYRRRPDGMPALRAKLIDRGLFMLTAGHVVIAVAHAPMANGIQPALAWGFITDVIAVGLLVGPILVERVPPRRRLAMAGAAYTLAWVVAAGWHPETAWLGRVREYVFGPLGARLVPECFPLLPWLAVYVAATVLGQHLGSLYGAGRRLEATATVTRAALACALVAVAAKGIPLGLTRLGLVPPSELVWILGWPLQKQPPSPAYLGLYTALALLLLRGLLAIDEQPRRRSWLAVPAALGRASLVAFVIQYYVYFTLMKWWSPAVSASWPLLLVASAGIVVGLGLMWARLGSNDVFSVGYRWHRASAMQPQVHASPPHA